MEDQNDFCLYVLVRTDLESLVGTQSDRRAGKVAAQVSHASTKFIDDVFVHDFDSINEQLKLWNGTIGFGTCIVLAISSLDEMLELVHELKLKNIFADVVTDPTYPLQDGDFTHKIPVTTCAYVFGSRAKLADFLNNLPLLP